MRSPALKPASLDASSSAPSSPGPTSPALTSPKSDPSYKLPITWFNGEVVARPKTSVWQSLKGKGKLIATQRGEKEDGTGVIAWDSSLAKWDWYLKARYAHFQQTLEHLSRPRHGGLEGFCSAYTQMGLIISKDNSVTYTEWVEGITSASLVGDFNSFSSSANPLVACSSSTGEGVYWTCHVPALAGGQLPIPIGSEIKIRLTTLTGETLERFPAYTLRATQNQPSEHIFRSRMEALPPVYRGARPPKPKTPKIYEAHIGAATENPDAVGTFGEFEKNVLWRVKEGGYNTLQLMGIMEHPYYASYGYQVSSYYAVSSRFGSQASLTSLIDAAHKLGIRVILDVVHSHSCANDVESLNRFNGTDGMYFREGKEGRHPIWGTRIFDYENIEVIRYLLSNLHFCVDRLGFDGFRFDSVSSMLFDHHAIDTSFTGDYGEYLSSETDHAGVEYLMLANHMLSTLFPFSTTIAEDFAGFPTLCLPTSIGGVGFDYRLALGDPHLWFNLLAEYSKGGAWPVQRIIATLGNRRTHLGEKSIGFVESHDECIEGGKTMAQWLFDTDIYENMSLLQRPSTRVQRGMALHKLIRLLTLSFAGEGYLNFMGNEFGHPEWLVFPSVQNGFKSDHCRRQWNLVNPEYELRYLELQAFDRQMLNAERQGGWGSGKLADVTTQDNERRLIAFTRSSHLLLFNFSMVDKVVIGTDDLPHDWQGKAHYRVVLGTIPNGRERDIFQLQDFELPSLSAFVLHKVDA